MAKFVSDTILDTALNVVKNGAVRLHICSTQPANYAGIAAVELGVVTIDSTDFTGPADGDTSGRKLAVNQQTGVSITASDNAAHIALSDNSAILYLVTTCTSQAVTSGNTATVNAFDWEILDAA